MNRRGAVCLLAMLLVSFLSLTAAEKRENELMKIDREFNDAVSARHLDGWMEYMADNAVLLRSGQQPVVGKEAIRNAMGVPFNNPNFSLTWEPSRAKIFRGGKMGYTVGRWTRTVKDGGQTKVAHGTYITVWEKQPDGAWKVVADGGADDPKK